MSGRCVDVLKRGKSLIGRHTNVIQSWVVGCNGRPGSFPTMHVLCRLCSRSPNDLLTTWHDFLTLYPRLLFIPDHSRSFWTVQNNREQSGAPRPSSPTSQDLPRPISVLSRLPYDLTRPLPTIKVGKGRLSGRLSVTGALAASAAQPCMGLGKHGLTHWDPRSTGLANNCHHNLLIFCEIALGGCQ